MAILQLPTSSNLLVNDAALASDPGGLLVV